MKTSADAVKTKLEHALVALANVATIGLLYFAVGVARRQGLGWLVIVDAGVMLGCFVLATIAVRKLLCGSREQG